MWGSLAGKINEQSGGLLTKIGDVVAPVLDDSVIEYYSDEDGSYYEEDDESSHYDEGELEYEDHGDYEGDLVHFNSSVSGAVNHDQDDVVGEASDLCVEEQQTKDNNENIRENGCYELNSNLQQVNNPKNDYTPILVSSCSDEHDRNGDVSTTPACETNANAVHIEANSDDHDERVETDRTNQPCLRTFGTDSVEKGATQIVDAEENAESDVQKINFHAIVDAKEGSIRNDMERLSNNNIEISATKAEEVQQVLMETLPDNFMHDGRVAKVQNYETTEEIENLEPVVHENDARQSVDLSLGSSAFIGGQLAEERESESNNVFLEPACEEFISQSSHPDVVVNDDFDVLQNVERAEREKEQSQHDSDESGGQQERFRGEERIILLAQFERKLEQQRCRFEEEKLELQRIAQSHIDECQRVKIASKNEIDAHKASKDQQIMQAQRLIEEADARTNEAERQLEASIAAKEMSASQAESNYVRLLREKEDIVIQTKKLADDRTQELQRAKSSASDMRSMLSLATTENHQMETKHKALEREIDELRRALAETQAAMDETQGALSALENENSDMGGLQMELRLMKEAHEREVSEIKSNAKKNVSSLKKIMADRDAAVQEGEATKRQLTQAIADLELSQKDHHHALLSCENMQRAIEAFQAERDAENALMEEQRADAEAAMKAAHEATINALKRSNDMKMQEVERAANNAVKNSMSEIAELEQKVEEYRRESNNTRKSLDEAIHRLQATQEDVIDRTLMKNILMDWHLRRSKKERRDVLEIMASVLHFTEEEKSKVGMAHVGILDGGLGKVVGAVAAPLPPSKLNPDKIEGDDLREKWVNFLIAESGEDA